MIRTIFPMSTEYDSNLPLVVKGIGVQNNQEHISRPTITGHTAPKEKVIS